MTRGIAVWLVALVAGCGSSSATPSGEAAAAGTSRPMRLADHETPAAPEPETITVTAPGADVDPADPPPVEPPSFEE